VVRKCRTTNKGERGIVEEEGGDGRGDEAYLVTTLHIMLHLDPRTYR